MNDATRPASPAAFDAILVALRAAIRKSETDLFHAETAEIGLAVGSRDLFDAQADTLRVRRVLNGRRDRLTVLLAAAAE